MSAPNRRQKKSTQETLKGAIDASGRLPILTLNCSIKRLAADHPGARFLIRVDAAGQYATNLLAFLQQLPLDCELSVGDPQRNQHYRKAHFLKRKADPTESHCAARFALRSEIF